MLKPRSWIARKSGRKNVERKWVRIVISVCMTFFCNSIMWLAQEFIEF